MTPQPRLVVCGGTGFLGTRICQSAVSRGWSVTSISRSGTPTWPSTPPQWSTSVAWETGNLLSPPSYRHHLVGATAVVHSMGILLEADYKRVLSGKESPLSGLRRAFDPREREGEQQQLTYEAMNRDSAISLAEEALAAGDTLQTLLYVSAAGGSFVLPGRYISTKREAEEGITRLSEGGKRFRPVFLRPGFLYDAERPVTVPLAGVMGVAAAVQRMCGGRLPLGAAGYRPLKVEVVGEAAVQALEGVEGVVEVDGIEELAKKAWRAGML